MSNKITGIVSNSGEDFVDELSSSIVYKQSEQLFAPIVKKLEDEGGVVNEALAGAVNTLRFGIMNYVIITVSEYALTKATLVSGAIFTYLKATNVAKRTKDLLSSAVSVIPFVGKAGEKAVNATVGFITKDRELIAKMGMDTSNNISTVISQERQTQVMIKQSQFKREDNTMNQAVSIRNKSRDSNISYFTHKTMTGTWNYTQANKKLYELATGQDFSKTIGLNWTQKFVDQLNSYSEFAKTSSGEIVNLSKATIDLINTIGYQKVQK